MTTAAPENKATMLRLPKYLAYLKIKRKQGVLSISSTRIAEDLRLNPVQVRKDLAQACQAGRPRTGYPMDVLIADLERYLGYTNTHDAFLVGAGRLGRALMGHRQFAEYGLTILAAFDVDPSVLGSEFDGKPVLPVKKLKNLAQRMQVRIGILAVPPECAQEAAELLVDSGIRAIWNFTTMPLTVPDTVAVQTENLAASFAMLCKQLTAMFDKERLEGGNEP